MKVPYWNIQQDALHEIANGSSHDEQQKRLRQIFSLPNYDVPAFTYYENKTSLIPTVTETMEIMSDKLCQYNRQKNIYKTQHISDLHSQVKRSR